MAQLGDIAEAGIDYISMTMRSDNPNIEQWLVSCFAYLREISPAADELVINRRLGYDGLSYGGSFVGRRERDGIAIFSGSRAKRAYALLYRADIHVSRIDAQVSYRYAINQPDVAQVARSQVARDNATISSARQRNATLIEDLRGGATCYIGGRTSEQFARIYNKETESGDAAYKNVWRYEVQLKNKLATKLAEQVGSQTYSPEQHAIVFVKQWLRHRGVSVPWKAQGELLPLPRDETRSTQSEARLAWLREQVRPALRQLLKYGLRDDIMAALGLDQSEPGE